MSDINKNSDNESKSDLENKLDNAATNGTLDSTTTNLDNTTNSSIDNTAAIGSIDSSTSAPVDSSGNALPMRPEDVTIKSVDEYYKTFYPRYLSEEHFRNIVHTVMDVGFWTKFGLSTRKGLSKKAYEKKAGKLVYNYAGHVRKELEDYKIALEIKTEEALLKKMEAESLTVSKDYQSALEAKTKAEEELNHIIQEKVDKIEVIDDHFTSKIESVKDDKGTLISKADELYDIDKVINDSVKEIVKNTGIAKVNEYGVLSFDEQKIELKLEDIFLDETLQGLETEGHFGQLEKTKRVYSTFINSWSELEDLSELPDVDWVGSIIYSRTRGYDIPVFPYFITGKYGTANEKAQGSLDTAISIDISGSMLENNRFPVAQKTGLAMRSLMRRLNSKNETYLSVFNKDFQPDIESMKLLREITPNGGTNTHFAIDWFAEKLKNSGPSIAYLITDGEPNDVDLSIDAAKRLSQYTNIMLRILLIDGNETTRNIVRLVGRAAGPYTKVIPVASRDLNGAAIMDVADAIGQMYTINNF